jgi:hypothetical protein
LITPEAIAARDKSEQGQQTALFCWSALAAQNEPALKLLHAIPNGGSRHKVEAFRLKASGVRAGVPDVCLPVPRSHWHGLYLELKVGKNYPSPEQKEWLRLLGEQGYQTAVCYSFEAARNEIISYLNSEQNSKA